LGEGGFGTVVLARGKLPGETGELYAIKAVKKQNIISSSSISEIFAEKEALVLTSGSPFVTTLFSCFQNKVCLNFLNILHIFRLSLILKFTVSVKI
jgi:serine/threonine protein kinase